MGKTVRVNVSQRRDREAEQLEKKFQETSRAEDLRRAKKQMESISREISEAVEAEKQYEEGLMVSFQAMGDNTLRRRIESIRQELLSTTSYARDLIEILAEMEDEVARRRDSACN
jgi:flagellar biosynthesis component FlhA